MKLSTRLWIRAATCLTPLCLLFVFYNHQLARWNNSLAISDYFIELSDTNKDFVNTEPSYAQFKTEFEYIVDSKCNAKLVDIGTDCMKELNLFYLKLESYFNRLNSCSIFNCSRYHKIYFHTFWSLGNRAKSDRYQINKRMLLLSVSSFLYTQNLCCTKLILWKTENFSRRLETELTQIFRHYIQAENFEMKTFSLIKICSFRGALYKSSFRKHPICNPNSIRHYEYLIRVSLKLVFNEWLVSFSDFVRFFILDFYGGVYFDGDVIFLRDASLLWNENFAYRWSHKNNWNTAVIGFNKYANPSISYLINFIVKKSSGFGYLEAAFHPLKLLSSIRLFKPNMSIYDYNGLRTYHSYFFDPSWLCADYIIKRKNNMPVCHFREFSETKFINRSYFKPEKLARFAFAYHVHTSSFSRVSNDSYFRYFESFYRKKLQLRLFNESLR